MGLIQARKFPYVISLCTKRNNSVKLLTDTKTEPAPYIIYNPKQSSNAGATYVTEVGFYSNATRVHFRTIGNSGQWIRISKKTVLKTNGKEYNITGTSTAAFSPNKLAFQRNGQVYDFYMDFPVLRKEHIKAFRIIEPESGGWDFNVQLD